MIAHLSYAASPVDGGISATLAQFLAAQRQADLDVCWITADSFPAWSRDRSLLAAFGSFDAALLHIHGLWRSPTRIASSFVRGDHADAPLPVVIAPNGMLDSGALRYSRWKKRIVWRLWERQALEQARCFHALVPAELPAIRSLGIQAPDPTRSVSACPPWVDRVLSSGERVLLFLGRFHAKKGIEHLLAAWWELARAAHQAFLGLPCRFGGAALLVCPARGADPGGNLIG